MLKWWILSVVLLCVRGEAEDCALPASGTPSVYPWQCCQVQKAVPTAMGSKMAGCLEKYPVSSNGVEARRAATCATQCIFQEAGMLDANNALNTNAFKSFISEIAKKHQDLALPDLDAVLDKCLAKAAAEVSSTQECKSGALELNLCLMRETFLQCPQAAWQASQKCDLLRDKVKRCENIPVMLVPLPWNI